jgi:hypothetical protein
MASLDDGSSASLDDPPRPPAEFSMPPLPTLPPMAYGCDLCEKWHRERKIHVWEAMYATVQRCSRCETNAVALSVYMSQQKILKKSFSPEYMIDMLPESGTREQARKDMIDTGDRIRLGDKIRLDSGLQRCITIFSGPTPSEIEICLDRQSPDLADPALRNSAPIGGYPYQNNGYGLSVPWSTGSSESLYWARGQLEQCERFHPQCRQTSSLVPKRILDLRITPGNGNDVRLRESRPYETGRYATLSHGWGKQQPPKTVKANLPASMQRLRLESLSEKFQQVIDFVRRLGIELLWIDSLCIVQDDELEKLEQIPRMSDIYNNSVLTIAASRSRDSQGSLFSTKRSFDIGFPLSTERVTGEGGFMVRKAFSHKLADSTVLDAWSVPRLHNVFPLLSRAWVLQERMLCPRMLHFGETELHWECSAVAACECGIEQSSNRKPSTNDLGISPRDRIGFTALVSYYTCLDLSYETDILSALQGIIRRIELTTGDKCVAGMWKSQLARCLCWITHKPSPRRRHANVPTWSWASLLSPITYWYYYSLGEVDPCSIELHTLPSTPTVPPSEYVLRLHRRVAVGTLKREARRIADSGYQFGSSTKKEIPFFADLSDIQDDDLYLIEISRGSTQNATPCLVLQLAGERRHGVFTRVGRIDLEPYLLDELFNDGAPEEIIYIV